MTIDTQSNTLYITDRFVSQRDKIDVTLVGAGGTGSAMLSMLFKLNEVLVRLGGTGLNVTVYDPKKVSSSNIARQSFWSDHDIGHYKSDLLIKRFNQFGGLKWIAVTEKFGENNQPRNIDLLITTVDTAKSRLEVGKIFDIEKYQTIANSPKWLDLGNSDSYGQAVLTSLYRGNGIDTLPSALQLFGRQWEAVSQDQIDVPSCSTEEAIAKQNLGVNDSLATNAVAMILFPYFRFGKINNHGFYFDLKSMTTTPMPISTQAWEIYGFKSE